MEDQKVQIDEMNQQNEHSIDELFSDHLNKCRCCFIEITNSDDQILIESWHRQTFQAMTGVVMTRDRDLANYLCLGCVEVLEMCKEFRGVYGDMQERYYKFTRRPNDDDDGKSTENSDDDSSSSDSESSESSQSDTQNENHSDQPRSSNVQQMQSSLQTFVDDGETDLHEEIVGDIQDAREETDPVSFIFILGTTNFLKKRILFLIFSLLRICYYAICVDSIPKSMPFLDIT